MFVPHKPWYFEKYIDFFDHDGTLLGFEIEDQIYFYDQHGGWADQQGCYYNSNCQPDGWLLPDGKEEILHYNQNKEFIRSYRIQDLDWLNQQEQHRKRRQSAIKQIQILEELGWDLTKITI
ncbi:unnamed protein product [Paramecium pentaurelia]|uniref:Uncharacterized protein n=1 Tax=Paramecium pentaurelia TaxID=43138 RepID=A0A8S1XI45_9CILI|nr:unnamed protein product [Paramecium pentaurelia]